MSTIKERGKKLLQGVALGQHKPDEAYKILDEIILTVQEEEREEAVDIINLILPFAKGSEANSRYIWTAQKYVDQEELTNKSE